MDRQVNADILAKIDDAVQVNLCACGCGRQLADNGPSADFIDYRHQEKWMAERNNPRPKPVAEWLDRLNESVTRAVEAEDCDDLNCPCHGAPSWRTEAHTVKPTFLRRMLDKIRRDTK